MDDFRRGLTVIVLGLALVLYLVFLVQAGVQSSARANRTAEAPLPDFPHKFLTVVGGAFAVHLGTVLGIQLSQGPRKNGKAALLEWWKALAFTKKLQIVLASVYFLSLCVALVFWWIDGWSETTTAPIPDLAWTLLGVILGVATSLGQP
jgi:hypothetical protein